MKETGLKSGTVYPLLMRMEERGLVEAEWRQPERVGRPSRHAYRLTLQGISLVQQETARDKFASGNGALA